MWRSNSVQLHSRPWIYVCVLSKPNIQVLNYDGSLRTGVNYVPGGGGGTYKFRLCSRTV